MLSSQNTFGDGYPTRIPIHSTPSMRLLRLGPEAFSNSEVGAYFKWQQPIWVLIAEIHCEAAFLNGNILAFTPGWCLDFDNYSSLEDKLFWDSLEGWLLFKLTFLSPSYTFASAPFHLLRLAPRIC